MTDLGFSIQELTIATRDPEAAAALYAKALGSEAEELVSYPQEGIGIDMTGVWVGDFHLAFVSDTTGTGHVARHIEKHGEGVSEMCLRTDDLRAAMDHMKAAGMSFTSAEPFVLKNYKWRGEVWPEVHVAFVHPKSSFGVQIEVQQWVR